jgi:ubiquinone/menaquinone biosynthesis C-methylase UbiE
VRRLNERFARLTTDVVVRRPHLWALLRHATRFQFDRLAATWDARRSSDRLGAFTAALEALPSAPRRALDLGTGTGDAAFAMARRWPAADVVGVDLAAAMVEQARGKLPAELMPRVRFEVADASRLPYPDAAFDLVAGNNMIPFFDELARVTAPGGSVVLAFSGGARTPIYVPPERLRRELKARGFAEPRVLEAGRGTAILAQKRPAD